MEGLHYGVTPEKRPRRLPRVLPGAQSSHSVSLREAGVGTPGNKADLRGGPGHSPVETDRGTLGGPGQAGNGRVLLSRLPLESLKRVHGNITHWPLPLAPFPDFCDFFLPRVNSSHILTETILSEGGQRGGLKEAERHHRRNRLEMEMCPGLGQTSVRQSGTQGNTSDTEEFSFQTLRCSRDEPIPDHSQSCCCKCPV